LSFGYKRTLPPVYERLLKTIIDAEHILPETYGESNDNECVERWGQLASTPIAESATTSASMNFLKSINTKAAT